MNTDIDKITGKMKSLTVLPSSDELDYSGVDMRNPKNAYAATIHLMMAHISDFHKLMVRIISEKYKISEDEMMSVIINHPDYTNMQVNPMFQSLGLFTQEDADGALAEMKSGGKETEEEKIEETNDEEKPKRRGRPPKNTAAANEGEPEQPPSSAIPVKRKMIIKKK